MLRTPMLLFRGTPVLCARNLKFRKEQDRKIRQRIAAALRKAQFRQKNEGKVTDSLVLMAYKEVAEENGDMEVVKKLQKKILATKIHPKRMAAIEEEMEQQAQWEGKQMNKTGDFYEMS